MTDKHNTYYSYYHRCDIIQDNRAWTDESMWILFRKFGRKCQQEGVDLGLWTYKEFMSRFADKLEADAKEWDDWISSEEEAEREEGL